MVVALSNVRMRNSEQLERVKTGELGAFARAQGGDQIAQVSHAQQIKPCKP